MLKLHILNIKSSYLDFDKNILKMSIVKLPLRLVFILNVIRMAKSFPQIGIMVPNVLLPRADVDLKKRAVVACDQYTSQLEYREEVANFVEQEPSTLSIIYPEVYLEEANKAERIQAIKQAMNTYITQ